jgi:glycosyltransferase involved in cell wall biosynthesis
LLFLARLHEKKGIHSLLSIDALLKAAGTRVQWTVIGNGPERDRFANAIAGHPDFVLHANLSNEEIIPYFSKNDIFVLPSSLDGVPLAMMETMSAGLVPVIYRFNEGIEKMFGDYAFVTPVGDQAALAASITRLDRDRSLLASYSSRCAALIHEKYDVNIRNQEYYRLFGQFRLLKKPTRYKIPNYGGYLEHPLVPAIIRKIVRRMKGQKNTAGH